MRLQVIGTKDVPNAIVVPYRGEVFVDDETHMVLRLTQQAEIPQSFPITANESAVDYEFAAVGGKQYLLPSRAYALPVTPVAALAERLLGHRFGSRFVLSATA